jgi:hypothetical protein
MNYPADSSGVSNTLPKRVHSNGPRALPAPTRISPAPTTEQKQHYNNDQ